MGCDMMESCVRFFEPAAFTIPVQSWLILSSSFWHIAILDTKSLMQKCKTQSVIHNLSD